MKGGLDGTIPEREATSRFHPHHRDAPAAKCSGALVSIVNSGLCGEHQPRRHLSPGGNAGQDRPPVTSSIFSRSCCPSAVADKAFLLTPPTVTRLQQREARRRFAIGPVSSPPDNSQPGQQQARPPRSAAANLVSFMRATMKNEGFLCEAHRLDNSTGKTPRRHRCDWYEGSGRKKGSFSVQKTHYRNPYTALCRPSKAWAYHITGLDCIVKSLSRMQESLSRMYQESLPASRNAYSKTGRPFQHRRWPVMTKTAGGLNTKKAYFALAEGTLFFLDPSFRTK